MMNFTLLADGAMASSAIRSLSPQRVGEVDTGNLDENGVVVVAGRREQAPG